MIFYMFFLSACVVGLMISTFYFYNEMKFADTRANAFEKLACRSRELAQETIVLNGRINEHNKDLIRRNKQLTDTLSEALIEEEDMQDYPLVCEWASENEAWIDVLSDYIRDEGDVIPSTPVEREETYQDFKEYVFRDTVEILDDYFDSPWANVSLWYTYEEDDYLVGESVKLSSSIC